MRQTRPLADFAESVKDKIIGALSPIEQLTVKAQVGQTARQAANVLLQHCVARILPPCVMRDRAATVDAQVARSFARTISEVELER